MNTHFLYGSEEEASKILDFIDKNKDAPNRFIPKLTDKIISFYHTNELFKNVIDNFYALISNNSSFTVAEYISGGERRDWFFSPIIAFLAKKKLLYIYKDLSVFYENNLITDLSQATVMHISDLITQASSYKRAWIPAITNITGNLIATASIVDRDEGGKEYLENQGIEVVSVITINDDFFNKIFDEKIITEKQLMMINEFKKDPHGYGKRFILEHPDFLIQSLHDEKTKAKAERCVKENPYNLNLSAILK